MPASRKPSGRKRQQRQFQLDPELQRDIAGVLLVLVALLTAITLFFPGGDVGRAWGTAVTRMFGWGSLVVAICVGAVGLLLVRERFAQGFALRPPQVAGIALLLVLLLGALHMAASLSRAPLAAVDAGEGGGQVGYVLSQALMSALGPAGAIIVMLGLAGIGAMVSLDVGVNDLRLGFAALRRRAEQFYNLHFRPLPPSASTQPMAAAAPPRRPEPAHAVEPAAASGQPVRGAATPAPAAGPAAPPAVERQWRLPSLDLLDASVEQELSQVDIRRRVKIIEDTLLSFNISARVVEVNQGPTVTQFGVQPALGVTVNRIVARANDLSLALAAAPIRVEAPVPGKSVVGIEVPNAVSALVALRSVIETTAFQRLKARSKLAFALGQDVSGAAVCADLGKMPHLLIAGATGSGKTVCLNAIIACLLFNAMPNEVRFIMVDPKMVELVGFNGIPHLITPVLTDVSKVVNVLKWATREMERRYKLFSAGGARNIEGYNRLPQARRGGQPLPYIVVIIDELADVMMMAPEDTERLICRLAQMARATGIHLLIATQRPSVDVITGLIKANFPARIAFAVMSQVDSRVVLDMAGAEKLLGRGDMLYMASDSSKTVRLQGAWVSDDELEQVVAFWKDQSAGMNPSVAELEAGDALSRQGDPLVGGPLAPWTDDGEADRDELMEQATDVVREAGRASASLLQRKLRIGYARASRLIDLLEEEGIVGGPAEGGRAREVLNLGGREGEDDAGR